MNKRKSKSESSFLNTFNFGYMIAGIGSRDFNLCFNVNYEDLRKQKILEVTFKSF